MITIRALVVSSVVALLSTPIAVSAQELVGTASFAPAARALHAAPVMIDSDPGMSAKVCRAPSGLYETEWAGMLATVDMDPEQARAALDQLVASVEVEAQDRPTDLDLQYLLAVVVGARAELESGRDAIGSAKDLHAQIERVLALDPEHPGAQHLLGRLQYAVMSMGRVQRFLATKVLGGDALSGASWEDAQSLLQAAVTGDPCRADHHYELARLFVDRGDEQVARRRLEVLLRLNLTTARDRLVMERARVLLDEIRSGN